MGEKILIIDDMKLMRNVLKLNLQRLGFTVIEAGDGGEGLEKATADTPDLVITDIMMANMDGLEFIQLFKMNKKFKNIPIIVLSAGDRKEDVLNAIKYGANDYIVKPYDTSDLLKKINKLLNINGGN